MNLSGVSHMMREEIIIQWAAAGGSGSDGALLTASCCDPSPSREMTPVASLIRWTRVKVRVVGCREWRQEVCEQEAGGLSGRRAVPTHQRPLNADPRSAQRGGRAAIQTRRSLVQITLAGSATRASHWELPNSRHVVTLTSETNCCQTVESAEKMLKFHRTDVPERLVTGTTTWSCSGSAPPEPLVLIWRFTLCDLCLCELSGWGVCHVLSASQRFKLL